MMTKKLVSARTIGQMKTSALLTLLTYYERTKNDPGRKLVEHELRMRRHEEES